MFATAALTLTVGVVNLVLALLVWVILHHRHTRTPVACWTLAALTAGGWMVTVALRKDLPDWLGYEVANALGFTSVALRLLALRLDTGLPAYWGRHALGVLVASGLYALAAQHPELALRFNTGLALHILGGSLLVHVTWQAARAMRSSAARLLARAEWLWVLVLLLRLTLNLSQVTNPHFDSPSLDNWGLVMLSLLLAIFSNLAYIGMVLDHSQDRAHQAQAAQLQEQLLRLRAEDASRELEQTLQQRDELFAQREQLLSVLSHEIRQPLHSAAGALLAAESALGDSPAIAQSPPIRDRLLHAQNVLVELRSVLDNTLAAAEILTLNRAPTLHDVDLDWLLNLVLGDLPTAQREQIDIRRRTRLRSLEVEPGLFRLALRNLLRNAFVHGLGIQGRVQLIVEESTSPPALCLRVVDHGPGLTEDRCRQLLEAHLPHPTGRSESQGRGLGLLIVRRIMALHGGHLELSPLPTPARGLSASLVFRWNDEMPELTPVEVAP